MRLLIDAGNTRTKWAVMDTTGVLLQGACKNDELSEFNFSAEAASKISVCSDIYISNVAGQMHASKLEKLLQNFNISLHFIQSGKQACNVINHYEPPKTLGTDRWAALIAAWQQTKAVTVVVNAGTAITIDALLPDERQPNLAHFAGGMILPGIQLMHKSLSTGTAQLSDIKHEKICQDDKLMVFGLNTDAAIQAGITQAAASAVEKMAGVLYEKNNKLPHIIISGGDAAIIASQIKRNLSVNLLIVDELVLKGLYLLSCSEQ